MIINMTGGGGGASLNYKVVGGTEQPASAAENTIWVDTDTAIASHAFSATEPANPVEGMVWFNLALSCSAPINVLKKGNEMYLYPTACQQYISGQWVGKSAMTYQNGEWIEWAVYLYKSGNLYEDITGGWEAKSGNWRSANSNFPSVTFDTDNIKIYQSGGNNSWGFATKNAIDITEYSKLVMKVIAVGYREDTIDDGLAVWTDTPKTVAAHAEFPGKSSEEVEVVLDISALTGAYYLGLRGSTMNSGTFDTSILEARLERS